MIYPKIPLAQSIIKICHAKGIKDIVISPGSRNAPLTIGFTGNSFFNCYSIADERCAAFFALGIAQQTKKPVVVLCTSGSALLNFYPAVAEAFYSNIPLIVISADRPKSKIDIGGGQTIRQENVFINHVHYSSNLTEEANDANDHLINEAINKALLKSGPVHINAPFEEPLYETLSKPSVDTMISTLGKIYKNIPLEDIIATTNIWNAAKKKIVLVGALDPNSLDLQVIEHLARDPSVLVMTESTSNMHHQSFINNIDVFITPFNEVDFVNFQPELLVTLGGMIVSKRIKSFIRNYTPHHHWHVDRLRAYNTFNCLTFHFEADANDFFNQFLPYTIYVESNFQEAGLKIRQERKQKHETFIKDIAFSDLKAFEIVLKNLKQNIQLQIANSSSIRYSQLFNLDNTIHVFCNRGTSGIDGSTSTAIGAALASKRETVLITGDISFLYDSNALWNNYIPKNFKIIVINNGGGGIFRILPGHIENNIFNTFFETSHCLTAEHLAKMYNFEYLIGHDIKTTEESIKKFNKASKPVILEVFTPTKDNNKILEEYFEALK